VTDGTVVVVDPYSSGAGWAAPLRRAGFEPAAATSFPPPTEVYRAAFRPGDFAAVLSADRGFPALVRQLAALAPIAVIPGAESGVILADRLAQALTPARANEARYMRARRHKGEMVRALAERGLPTIRSVCGNDVEAIRRWVAAEGMMEAELVVKPVMSGGTDGVRLVSPDADLGTAIDALLGSVDVLNNVNTEVIVQERVVGTEYVVDTVSFDGRVSVTNVCRYSKVSDGTRFAVYESMTFVPFDTAGNAELIAFARQCLDALGVRFGPAHSEVMVTAGGPRLVEVGARLPGAGLPGATIVATGENGISRLIRHLRGETGIRLDYTLERAVTVVYFIAAQAGVISNVGVYHRIAELPSCRHLRVNVRDGDRVAATTGLLSTMSLGWALLAHRDPAQVERDHQTIRALERRVCIADPAEGDER
jgi:biotin carboxylase